MYNKLTGDDDAAWSEDPTLRTAHYSIPLIYMIEPIKEWALLYNLYFLFLPLSPSPFLHSPTYPNLDQKGYKVSYREAYNKERWAFRNRWKENQVQKYKMDPGTRPVLNAYHRNLPTLHGAGHEFGL